MAKPQRKLPDGGKWNQAAWADVRKRAISMAGDDPHCAICGKPLDPGAPQYSSNAIEVDHIVPISRGGLPYDIDNLQVVCLTCNRRKGKKMADDCKDKDDENPIPLSNAW